MNNETGRKYRKAIQFLTEHRNIRIDTEQLTYLGLIAHSLAVIADALTKETTDEK